MKALVLQEYKHFEYAEVPKPPIEPDEVLIRVQAVGTCGSDIHGMDGSSGRRIPPVIMGHEASGIIETAGKQAGDWKSGDRVTFDSTIYCSECYHCRRGEINLCDNRRVLGVSTDEYKQQGAYAEYVALPSRILYRLPDKVTFEQAAMVEPCSIAFHGVQRTPISLNDTALVAGAGMVGLLTIQALRLAGCGRIIAVDPVEGKLELAKQLGADAGINPEKEDVAGIVREQTEGRGADIGFEVVGSAAALQTALAGVRKGGSVTLIGNLAPMVELPLQSAVTREITLYGSCASQGEYPACLDMIARGAINVDALVSAIAPLSEGAKWFQRLYDGEPGLMKVIFQP